MQQNEMKASFTLDDDKDLKRLVQKLGESGSWDEISRMLSGGNKFTPIQCRDRYFNYMKRNCNSDPFTDEEDKLLIDQVSKYGHRWTLIENSFANRSRISLKSRWFFLERSHMKNNQVSTGSEEEDSEDSFFEYDLDFLNIFNDYLGL